MPVNLNVGFSLFEFLHKNLTFNYSFTSVAFCCSIALFSVDLAMKRSFVGGFFFVFVLNLTLIINLGLGVIEQSFINFVCDGLTD